MYLLLLELPRFFVDATIMTVVSESVSFLSAASPKQGSGENRSNSESGEVKVGRMDGRLEEWIDLLVGGVGDGDGDGN